MQYRIMIPTESPKAVKRYAKMVAEHFGGCSLQRVEGLWINAAGEMVEDTGYFLIATRISGSPVSPLTDAMVVEMVAAKIATDLHQDCVYTDKVDATARLVSPFSAKAA